MSLSGARWGGIAVRAALALLLMASAVPAYRYSEAAALRVALPLDEAKATRPDSKALANALGHRFDQDPQYRLTSADRADIRSALITQPLEPRLLSFLGLDLEASGKIKPASEIMRLANRVSRRDSLSGLYLIESASAAGDIKTALKHYNSLLLTRPELNQTLLPILSAAIIYPEIRAELRPYLAADAKWAPAFLSAAAGKADVADLEKMLLPLPGSLLSDRSAPILASILHRIAIEGDRASAERFARAIAPGSSSGNLSELAPSQATLDKRLGLFSWTFPPTEGMRVEMGEKNSLEIFADPLSRGRVAARNLLLDEGASYQFLQKLAYGYGSVRLEARWSADCITKAGVVRFWDQGLPQSVAGGTYRSVFTVPRDCRVVRLTLSALGPDGQMPASLSIGDLTLSRAAEVERLNNR